MTTDEEFMRQALALAAQSAGEDGEKLWPADAAAIVADGGAGLDGLLPAAEGLKFDTGK